MSHAVCCVHNAGAVGSCYSQLTQLCLTGLEAPPELWWPRDGLSRLEELSFRGCGGVRDATLDGLADMQPRLKTLTIAGEQGQ